MTSLHIAIDAVGIRSRGGATVLREFLRWLPAVRPEFTWTVYLLPPAMREFADPEPHPRRTIEHVARGDSATGRVLWLWRDLPRRVQAAGVDVVFSFANIGMLSGLTPRVTYLHQALAFPELHAKKQPLSARVRYGTMRFLILNGARKSHCIVVQTEDMQKRLRNADPALESRIAVIPGSVSDVELPLTPTAQMHRIAGTTGPRLLYVASSMPHKNHATLLRALPAVIARFPQTTLLLTLDESCSAGDNRYFQSLRALADQLGIEAHIAWLGNLQPSEVRYALQNCSLAVFPSTEEAFGLPLAEAIVEGSPLVAADRPYAHDVAGQAALYFNPLDPASLAAVLNSALEHPDILADLKARQAVRAPRFDPAAIAEAVALRLESAFASSARQGK